MWHVCHLRADSVVELSHKSSIYPWLGVPKVRLYDTFLGSLRQCKLTKSQRCLTYLFTSHKKLIITTNSKSFAFPARCLFFLLQIPLTTLKMYLGQNFIVGIR